ncbi:DUF3596 domain-containing protein [Erwinia tracheiphila]|uniref:DUF3596 domain-containing protein n=1 Tax=Erwinia tracheiphila TaxID=65700 RepID=A0A345CRN8_9GAMM|nr:DUF3596 domain-containing protein [Erwinia tracheiphila]AXF76105.1 DUF3596 domain-containing protein [Erwinia tracheiphila]UIA85230.1 DUF3596 domain-containing protein [Erwinia tracheiphila]
MAKYPTGVAPNKNHLRIWFMYQGKRMWEALGVPDTPKNRKMAGELRDNIVYRIKTGNFDYRSQFPDSPAFKNELAYSAQATIREVADIWLKLKKPELANSTYTVTARRLRTTIEKIGESVNIRSVRQQDLLSLRVELLTGSYFVGRKRDIEKKGRTAATVNTCMGDICAVMKFAQANGYIDLNPMENISPLKKVSKKPDPILRDEFPRLIGACKSRQVANLWALAIMTGLRHGELCALAWEDIDLTAKTITVTRNLTSQGLFTPPKTEAGNNRIVSLVDAAVSILRDQLTLTRMLSQSRFEFHTREYGQTFHDEKTFVFNPSVNATNRRCGSHYAVDSIGQTWDAAIRKAGLRHRKAYQSRHTYACWSLSAGANPNFVASQMGHADAQMVYRIYGTWMAENNTQQLTLMNAKLNEFVLHACYDKEAM